MARTLLEDLPDYSVGTEEAEPPRTKARTLLEDLPALGVKIPSPEATAEATPAPEAKPSIWESLAGKAKEVLPLLSMTPSIASYQKGAEIFEKLPGKISLPEMPEQIRKPAKVVKALMTAAQAVAPEQTAQPISLIRGASTPLGLRSLYPEAPKGRELETGITETVGKTGALVGMAATGMGFLPALATSRAMEQVGQGEIKPKEYIKGLVKEDIPVALAFGAAGIAGKAFAANPDAQAATIKALLYLEQKTGRPVSKSLAEGIFNSLTRIAQGTAAGGTTLATGGGLQDAATNAAFAMLHVAPRKKFAGAVEKPPLALPATTIAPKATELPASIKTALETTPMPVPAPSLAEQLAGKEVGLPPQPKPVERGVANRALSIVGKDPDIALPKPIQAKDIRGNKIELPPDTYTPHKLNTGNVLLKDGEQFTVSNNQYQNIKNQSKPAVAGEFAPELKQVETMVISDRPEKTEADIQWKQISKQNEPKIIKGTLGDRKFIIQEQTDGGYYVAESNAVLGMPVRTYAEAIETINRYLAKETAKPKFSQYTLPGGENYREVLIKAPKNKLMNREEFKTKQLNLAKEMGFNDPISEANIDQSYTAYKNNPSKFYPTGDFKSSHWDEPNVLSHLRLNDRTTPDGKKVLFLEELQSDWAAKTRKEGVMVAPTKPSNAEIERVANNNGVYFTEGAGKTIITNREGVKLNRAMDFDNKQEALNKYFNGNPERFGGKTGTVDHPLLKSWQSLSLKRALKEAVDGNYEYLSWVSGKQTADRYNLAKQVNSIEWNETTHGGRTVHIMPKGQNTITILTDKKGEVITAGGNIPTGWMGKKLDEVIGKGVAEKILTSNDGHLEGNGLNIGGEWATNLYDRQVPNLLKDLTGEKAGTLKFLETNMRDLTNTELKELNHLANLVSRTPEQNTRFREGLRLVQYLYLGKLNDGTSKSMIEQQAIKITPEIKAMVKGEPLAKKPSGIVPVLNPPEVGLPSQPKPVIRGVAQHALSIVGKGADITTTQPIIIKDVRGNKVKLPPDTYTPHKLNTGNVLLKDGEQFTVSNAQYQAVKNQGIEEMMPKEKRPRTSLPKEVLDKAVNINLNKLQTTNDARKLIQDIAKEYRPQMKESQQKISWEETKQLAKEINMTPERLKQAKAGTLSSDELEAARQLFVRLSEDTAMLSKKARETKDDVDIAKAAEAVAKQVAIQASWTGHVAEAGRALGILRSISKASGTPAERSRQIIQVLKGREFNQEMADRLAMIDPTDQVAFNKFLMSIHKATKAEMLYELWLNNILSAFPTHMANILGNTLGFGYSIPERMVAVAVDTALSSLTGERTMFASEIPAMLKGSRIGFVQGVARGLKALSADTAARIETTHLPAIPGKIGEMVRIPTKMLGAEDEFFKAIIGTSELYSLAARQATREGLKGKAFDLRVAELAQNPTDSMQKLSMDEATYRTFQNELGEIGNKLMAFRKAGGLKNPTQWILPFIKTPANISKVALHEYTPLGGVVQATRAAQGKYKFGKGFDQEKFAKDSAKSIMGTAVFAAMTMLVLKGLITGRGPKDKTKKQILYKTGWQPRSIKVGGQYLSYARIQPLGMILSALADSIEAAQAGEKQSMLGVLGTMASNMADQTFLSGAAAAMNAILDPGRYADKWIERALTGFVPISAMGRVIAQQLDTTIRKPKGIGATIMAQTPGLTGKVLPSVDIFGKEQKRVGGWSALLAIPISKETGDKLAQDMVKLGVDMPDAPKKLTYGNRTYVLTPEQQNRYLTIRGEQIARRFRNLPTGTDEQRMRRYEVGLRIVANIAKIKMARELREGK